MPTYEYACSKCGATLERQQRFSEAPLSECPSCGGSLRRVFQPVGVIFKGSGWYCNDSRANGKSGADCASCESNPATSTAGTCSGHKA